MDTDAHGLRTLAVFWVLEGRMFTTRITAEQLKEFEEKVQQTARKFPDDVIRIRYSFDEDWYGDPAIHFRVVLSDEATRDDRFADVIGRVRDALFEDLRLDEAERIPYFNFRSKSEEDKLRTPEWA